MTIKKTKWYKSYNPLSLFLSGIFFFLPLGTGVLLGNYTWAIWAPLLFFGFLSTGFGITIFVLNLTVFRKRYICSDCGKSTAVKADASGYKCSHCGKIHRIVDKEGSKEEELEPLTERIPYLKVLKNYKAARRYEKSGNLERAVELYLQNIHETPDVGVAQYERAVSLLEKLDRDREALEIARLAQKNLVKFARIPFWSFKDPNKIEYIKKEFGDRIAKLEKKLS